MSDSTQGTTPSANEAADETTNRPEEAAAEATPKPTPDTGPEKTPAETAPEETSPEPKAEEAPEPTAEAAAAEDEAEPVAETAEAATREEPEGEEAEATETEETRTQQAGAEVPEAETEEPEQPRAEEAGAEAAEAEQPQAEQAEAERTEADETKAEETVPPEAEEAPTPPPEPAPKRARPQDRGEETTAQAEKRVAEEAAAARTAAEAEAGAAAEETKAPAAGAAPEEGEEPAEEKAAEEKGAEAEAAEAKAGDDKVEAGEEKAAEEEEKAAETETEEPKLPDDPVSLKLLAALESGEPVEGKVFGWNQGGYHVLIDGLLAFCPRSEIELGNPKSPKKYIEKTYPFRVIEHRPEGNRFIVSRSKVLEEQQAERRAAVKERLSQGAELEGRVTSLTGFGAFVDLGGGIEGMVHVSELSHRSVDHPKDLVKKGQKVKVRVLKIEKGGDRISLSMKALEKNPWAEFADEHPRGSEFGGKITGKTDFGIFVEVEPGMEGLVHVSALPPGASLEDEGFEEGKEVSGWVKETEVKRQRISLSLRPVPTSDPWKDVRDNYPEGDVVAGTVEEIAPFGVFINLEPGLTGLLPNSEMNLPRGTHPGRVYSPGTEVKVQVGRIEPKRKRITLVPEGAKIEGSRTDYKEFKKKVSSSGGMPTLAAAFEKLKKDDD